MAPQLKLTVVVGGANIRLRLLRPKCNGFCHSPFNFWPGKVIEAGSALPDVPEKRCQKLGYSRYS